jgi:hypothetical protein
MRSRVEYSRVEYSTVEKFNKMKSIVELVYSRVEGIVFTAFCDRCADIKYFSEYKDQSKLFITRGEQ